MTARYSLLLTTYYSRLTTHDLGPPLGLFGAILGFEKEPPNFQQLQTRYWSLVLSYHWSLLFRHIRAAYVRPGEVLSFNGGASVRALLLTHPRGKEVSQLEFIM